MASRLEAEHIIAMMSDIETDAESEIDGDYMESDSDGGSTEDSCEEDSSDNNGLLTLI